MAVVNGSLLLRTTRRGTRSPNIVQSLNARSLASSFFDAVTESARFLHNIYFKVLEQYVPILCSATVGGKPLQVMRAAPPQIEY